MLKSKPRTLSSLTSITTLSTPAHPPHPAYRKHLFHPPGSCFRRTSVPSQHIGRAQISSSISDRPLSSPLLGRTTTTSARARAMQAADMSTTTTQPPAAPPATAPTDLSPIEAAKRKAAYRAVAEHFNSNMNFVGIGSGSTIVYGVEAIKAHLDAHPPEKGHINWFVPTGWNSRKVIEQAGLIPIAFDSLPADALMDVCFDGADEVDEDLNCIKGGGACLFQEKLVATRSKKFICIADYRKEQKHLLTNWPSIPIEVAPIAHATVIRELKLLGSPNPLLREHSLSKTGPVQTDQSFYIIDAPFPQLLTSSDLAAGADGSGENKDRVYEVDVLARKIKAIHGVLEVGLFFGENGEQVQARGGQGGQKPVAVYFGLENGEVSMKRAKDRDGKVL